MINDIDIQVRPSADSIEVISEVPPPVVAMPGAAALDILLTPFGRQS